MKLKNLFKRKENVIAVDKIDRIISDIEKFNPEAAAIVRKRKNLLFGTTADTPDALIQVAFRTYHEGTNQSTHIRIPPTIGDINYFSDQLTFLKADGLAPQYRSIALGLQLYDTQIRRTDIDSKKAAEYLVKFDKFYNDYLKIHAEALNAIGNPKKDKYPYQSGIQ